MIVKSICSINATNIAFHSIDTVLSIWHFFQGRWLPENYALDHIPAAAIDNIHPSKN
jgi:hypothetical protein